MKLMKNKTLTFLILISLCLLTLFSTIGPNYVLANSSVPIIEETDVLEDLEDMSIDGKPFSLQEYSYNEKKETQILSFMEYCYSPFADKQEDYSLYVYIYNPRNLKFDLNSASNNIEFSITDGKDDSYEKYQLILIDVCDRPNYENLFLKFKVKLSEEQKEYFLNTLNAEIRVYNVSSFELLVKGQLNVHDYKNALTYKYSGYAKGCGPNSDAESTLTVFSDYLTTMKLDVNYTYYRPDGHDSESSFTQDSLHSVYFAVSNDYDVYGTINAIHARWLRATLAPSVVLNNEDAISAFKPYLGKDITSFGEDIGYMLLGNALPVAPGFGTTWYYDYGYNAFDYGLLSSVEKRDNGRDVNPLYFLYDAVNFDGDVNDYVVNRSEIRARLEESVVKYGGELVLDKYARCMFDSVDKEFTDKNIQFDYEFTLDNFVVGDKWWEKLLGVINKNDKFNNIQAIYAVKESDLKGTDEEIAKRLFIAEPDVDGLKDCFNKNKNSTVYLFRYRISNYFSQRLHLFKAYEDSLGLECLENLGFAGYFFQEEVDLDFDIIDITFLKNNVKTVVPVIMDPIDVIHDGTGPLGNKGCTGDLLTILLSIFLVFILFWILSMFGGFKLIGNVCVFVITAPFKFVKWIIGLFKGGGKK